MSFDFLKSLLPSSSYLGVDIGTTSIKIVEISKSSGKPMLKNYGILESYGHLERLNDAIQTSSLRMMDRETAELLRILLKQMKFKSRDVVASIPSFSMFATLLEIPIMEPGEAAKVMQYQVRQHIPLPVSEVTIDWIKVGEREDDEGAKKQQIFLISVPNEQIKKYQSIFKAVGLNLKSLEVESFSLVRALITNDQTPTLIVDIGSRSTNIVAVDQGSIKANTQTDFAGGSITQAIANGLNIGIKRAEELKKQRGILDSGGGYELSTVALPFVDAIISEAVRAKDSYEKTFRTKLERIILAGGGASMLGIDKYFEGQMKLPTVIGNPFSQISYPEDIEPMVKELGPSFSVAIGLGIREFIK